MNCDRCKSPLQLTPDEQRLACQSCYPDLWEDPIPRHPSCRCVVRPILPEPQARLRCIIQLSGWREALGPKRCEVCRTKVRPVRWFRLGKPDRLVWRCQNHKPTLEDYFPLPKAAPV